MSEKEVLAIIRRLRIKLVKGRNGRTSDNVGDDRNGAPQLNPLISFKKNLNSAGRFEILRKLSDESHKDSQNLPITPNEERRIAGAEIASPKDMSKDRTIVPIGNAPVVAETVSRDFPDHFEFEIYKARNRIAELEAMVKDKDQRIMRAITIMESEVQYWHRGLYDHVWESMGEIERRVKRLQGTVELLKDLQPRVIPPLEIPAGWRKTGKLTDS